MCRSAAPLPAHSSTWLSSCAAAGVPRGSAPCRAPSMHRHHHHQQHAPQSTVPCRAASKHRTYQSGASHSGYGGPSANGMRPSSASVPGRDRGLSPAASHTALANPHPLNSAHLMHDAPPPQQLPAAQLHNAGLKPANGSGGLPPGNENSMAAVNAGDRSANGHSANGASGYRASPHMSAAAHPASGAGTPVPADGGSQPPRVDGKDFFRQVRGALPRAHVCAVFCAACAAGDTVSTGTVSAAVGVATPCARSDTLPPLRAAESH